MTKLDWENAKRRDKTRDAAAGKRRRRKSQHVRKGAMYEFAKKHGLNCFRCGAEQVEWAKTGISKRGPWAICVACVSRPSD